MIIDEDVYLEHYGVKGMKWGVRKKEEGGSSDRKARRQERRETKAKKYDAEAAKYQDAIRAVDQRLATAKWYQKNSLASQRQTLVNAKVKAERNAAAVRAGKMTSKQKGAVAVGALVAAYGTYRLVNSGETNRMILKGKAFVEGNKDSVWKKNAKLSRKDMDVDEIMNDVVKHVNPGYGGIGTKVNCRRATFSYEMRRRGYDVSATRTTNSHGQNAAGLYNALSPDRGKNFAPTTIPGIMGKRWSELSKKDKGKITETPFSDAIENWGVGKKSIDWKFGKPEDSIFSALRKEPDGSRGELGVLWGVGGGHSMAYEIVKGRPVIFDTQSGKKYQGASDLLKDFGEIGIAKAGFTRLDNVQLNEEFLMRWVRNAR